MKPLPLGGALMADLLLEGLQPTSGGRQPTTDSLRSNIDGLQPRMHGLQPNSDGLQPRSVSLQPNSNGLQPNSDCTKLNSDALQPRSDQTSSAMNHHHQACALYLLHNASYEVPETSNYKSYARWHCRSHCGCFAGQHSLFGVAAS